MKRLLSRALLALGLAFAPAILAVPHLQAAIHSAGGAPAFRGAKVTKSGTQALTTNVQAAVTWSTEVYDAGGYFDSVASTSRFTIPAGEAGYYRVIGQSDWQSTSNRRDYYCIHKNSSNVEQGRGSIMIVATATASEGQAQCNYAGLMAVGDYLQVDALVLGVSINFNTGGAAWMSIEKIGTQQ